MVTSKELTEALKRTAEEVEDTLGTVVNLAPMNLDRVREVNLPASLEEARARLMNVAGMAVATEDDFRAAEMVLRDLATLSKRAEATRKERAAPVDAEKKAIQDLYMPVIRQVDDARHNLETRMLTFRRQENAAREALEAKLRAEKEAEAEAARKASDEAFAAGDLDTAADKAIEAYQAAAPMLPSRSAITPSSGISSRKRWVVEDADVDLVALIRAASKNPKAYSAFLTPNLTALRQRAQQQGDSFDVPGVKPRREEGLTVRG
jgi:hypothetical protein